MHAARCDGASALQVLREDLVRVFSTCLLVSAFEAAILVASSVFITLPFTIPRLLNVQLAVAIVALEGKRNLAAVRESKARMLGFRRCVALALGLVRPPSALQPLRLHSPALSSHSVLCVLGVVCASQHRAARSLRVRMHSSTHACAHRRRTSAQRTCSRR
jgi:hypothetical protein